MDDIDLPDPPPLRVIGIKESGDLYVHINDTLNWLGAIGSEALRRGDKEAAAMFAFVGLMLDKLQKQGKGRQN